MYDDGPDDDYMTGEQACDAGWMMPDDVEELRNLLKHVVWPTEMTEGRAAMVLIEHLVNPVSPLEGDQLAIYNWAKVKLGRHVLV